MINFFYHPGYAKRKKVIFTLNLRRSVLLNKLINLTYLFNIPFPSNYITNGTHKCMNNSLKALRKNTKSSYNKDLYPNSYILQFDWYGEKMLNQILNNKIQNKKILIGPLYTNEQLKNLVKYVNKYDFIKIVAASKNAAQNISNNNLQINKDSLCVIPTGIISEKKLLKMNTLARNDRCLIYYKNREEEELQKVTEFLKNKNYAYDLFEYGKYSNSQLIRAAKNNKFCILLNSSESQGIAVQEIMSANIPLYVWNISSKYDSSVPYFDERCGIATYNYDEFVNKFELFINTLNSYSPKQLILDKLTFEKFIQNLEYEFDEITC